MSVRRISVVVPVYNEHETIAPCLRDVSAALRGEDHEILVCYDRDDDTTLGAIAAMPDRPEPVRLVKNDLGPGAAFALRAGFRAATGDVVVTVMADRCDPPEHIAVLAAKVRSDGAHVVSGSRYSRGGRSEGAPAIKGFLSRAAGVTLRVLTGIPTWDTTTNFRAYAAGFLREVAAESRAGFEVALELTVKAHLRGYRVAEVPSQWVERAAGQSRFRVWAWLPAYLRWYLQAAAEPLLAWGLLVVLAILAPAAALPCAAVSAFVLAGARRARGRTVAADALIPALFVGGFLAGASPSPILWTLLATLLGALYVGLVFRLDRDLPPRPDLPRRGRLGQAGLGVAGLLLWLSAVHLPSPRQEPALDASWRHAFSHFYLNRMQAGVDYVATYGPLGWLFESVYDRTLLGPMIAWEVGFKLVLAVLGLKLAVRLPGGLPRLLFVGILFLALPLGPDGMHLAALLLALVLFCGSRPSGGNCLALAILVTVLSLIKFTFFLLALLGLGLVLIRLRQVRPRPGAAIGAALFIAAFLLAWAGCGQSISHLPAWVGSSLQVTASYGEAMALEGRVAETWAGLIGGVAALCWVAWVFRAALRERRASEAAVCAFVAIALFLAWKAGVVRQDWVHLTALFTVAMLTPFLAPPAWGGRPWSRFLPHLAALPAVAGLLTVQHLGTPLPFGPGWWGKLKATADTLTTLPEVPERYSAREETLRSCYDLPRTRARVGSSPIDIHSPNIELLFLNRLNWRPRPILGPYSTWTPAFAKANADFLRSPRAPEFILLQPHPIDDRFLPIEDAEALQVILRDYAPLLDEDAALVPCFVLRRRRAGQMEPLDVRSAGSSALRFGERLPLPDPGPTLQGLKLDLSVTIAGRVRGLMLRTPALHLVLHLEDGRALRKRIVPGMTKSGFIVNPVMSEPEDLLDWCRGRALPRAVAVEIVPGPGGEGAFAAEARAEVLDLGIRRP